MTYHEFTYHLTTPLAGVGIAITRIWQLLATLEELVHKLIRPPPHAGLRAREPDSSIKRSVKESREQEQARCLFDVLLRKILPSTSPDRSGGRAVKNALRKSWLTHL